MFTLLISDDNDTNVLYLLGNHNREDEALFYSIQHFVRQAKVSFHSDGSGYGTLFINSNSFSVTPYGIDLETMANWCGITK